MYNGVSFWWFIIMNLSLCFRIVLQWSHAPLPTTATATCLTVQSPTMAAQASLTTTGESTVSAVTQLQTHRWYTSFFYPSTLINTNIDTNIGLICGCGYNFGNKQVSHREQLVGNLSTSANHPPERTQPAHTVHIQTDLYNYQCLKKIPVFVGESQSISVFSVRPQQPVSVISMCLQRLSQTHVCFIRVSHVFCGLIT